MLITFSEMCKKSSLRTELNALHIANGQGEQLSTGSCVLEADRLLLADVNGDAIIGKVKKAHSLIGYVAE